MRKPFLQITYRDGQAEIAYLSLARKPGERCAESEHVEPEMVLDFNAEGELIGIEILDPHEVTVQDINSVLEMHHHAPLSERELAPLVAA